jgi:uncharacterized protein YecE (DUF72 family)
MRTATAKRAGNVFIGTSGWSYKSWEKAFYPDEMPRRRHFEYYATQFNSVEINATFYRLPTLKVVRGWRDKAPEGFVFAAKGSRYITHIPLPRTGRGRGARLHTRRIETLGAVHPQTNARGENCVCLFQQRRQRPRPTKRKDAGRDDRCCP